MPVERRFELPQSAHWRGLLGRLSHTFPVPSATLSNNSGLLVAALVFAVAYVADSHSRNAGIDGARLSGAIVAVGRVTAPEAGFLVVHSGNAARNSIDPAALAYVPVRAGVSTDITVELRRTTPRRDPLFVVLHSDTGEKGVFEYSANNFGTDPPRAAAGDLVWAKVSIE